MPYLDSFKRDSAALYKFGSFSLATVDLSEVVIPVVDYTGLLYNFNYQKHAAQRPYNFAAISTAGTPTVTSTPTVTTTPATSAIFLSSPYLYTLQTTSRTLYLTGLNYTAGQTGLSFVIDADLSSVTDNLIKFIDGSGHSQNKISIYYNRSLNQWQLIDSTGSLTIANTTTFNLNTQQSYTFTIQGNPIKFTAYVNGVQVATQTFGRALYTVGNTPFVVYAGFNNNFKIGAFHYWTREIAPIVVANMHFGDKRQPFKRVTYLDVARFRNLAIFCDYTNNSAFPYGVTRDPTLANFGDVVGAFTSQNTTSLPTRTPGESFAGETSHYLSFNGTANRITYTWNYGVSWFDSRVFILAFTLAFRRRNPTAIETIFTHRLLTFAGAYENYFTLRFISSTQFQLITIRSNLLQTKTYTYPSTLNNGVIEIVVFGDVAYLNGVEYPSVSVTSAVPTTATAPFCTLGCSQALNENAAIDLYYFDAVTVSQFNGVPSAYSNNTGALGDAASLFAQLNFKKSLAAQEPNHPRLALNASL
jgi:hypothetical protein